MPLFRACRRPLRRLAAGLSSVLFVLACGEATPPAVVSLIGEAPAELWRFPERVTREERLPALARRWSLRRAEAEPSAVGWRLRAGRRAGLTRTLPRGQKATAVLELELAAPPADGWRLQWTPHRTPFDPRRSVPGRRAGERTLRFALDEHADWHPTVHRIRLLPPRGATTLVALRYVERRRPAAALAERLARAHRVDLGGEVRDALPAPPGVEIARSVEVAAGSRLELAWGVAGKSETPIRFVARTGDGEVLLDDLVEPGSAGWRERRVELGRRTRGTTRLTFVTHGTADPARTLPVWGELRVVGRGAPRRPDVVLVSIDTLRADHLSLYGYPEPTSPRLDAWAEEHAAVFLDAVAPSPWTLPSHVSMLTGLDPLDHGVNHRAPVAASFDTLAERLRAAGYATRAVTGGAYLSAHYGLHQGFEVFRYWPDRRRSAELATHAEVAADWLATRDRRPLFLFFHTYEVHMPYERAAPDDAAQAELARSLRVESLRAGTARRAVGRLARLVGERMVPLASDEVAQATELYDRGITYADRHLGELLERVAARGRPTVVVVTSDHGELLGENGLAGHEYLLDSNLRVPLLVALPGGDGAGTRIGGQVGLVDVVPTILDAVGLTPPPDLAGRSLLPAIAAGVAPARPVWTYAALTNRGLALRFGDRLKLRYDNTAWRRGSPVSIHDPRDDPHETRDLAAADPARTAVLRRRAEERYRQTFDGLVVRVEARTGAVAGSLASPNGWRPSRVKALSLPRPRPRLDWHRGGTRFTAPAGAAFDLYLEKPLPPGLELALDGEFATLLDDVAGGDTLRLARHDGWAPVPGPAAAADAGAVVTVEHRARRATAPGDDGDVAPELVEQLRALGYVQ